MITRTQVLSRAAIATVLSTLLLTYLLLRVSPYQPNASLDRASIALLLAGLFVFVAGVGTLLALILHQRWPGLAGYADDELLPLVAVRQGILLGLAAVVIALLAIMQLLDIVFIAFALLVAGLFEAFLQTRT